MKRKDFNQLKSDLFINKALIIPSNIFIIINKYSDRELQQITGLSLKPELIREYCFLIISNFNTQIINYIQDEEIIDIQIYNNNEFKETKINGKRVRVKQVIIKFLQRIGLIIRTTNYSTGSNKSSEIQYIAHARYFILNTEYINGGVVKVVLKEKKTREINNKLINDRLELCFNNIIAENQLKMILKFEELDTEEIYTKGLNLIGTKYKGNDFYEFNDEKKRKSDKTLENHMKLYEYIMENGLLIPKVKEESGRVFTSFNAVPSWIRKEFKINSKNTVGVDVSKSVPSIINMMFGGKEINYNKFNKYDIIKFLFSDNYKSENFYKEIYNDFKLNNNELLKTITALKNSIGNSGFAKMIYKIESEVMEKSIIKLNKKHIEVYYIFDELICATDKSEIVKEIMNETLKEFKINTFVK